MREKEQIKRNYITIAYYCGLAMVMISCILLLPLFILPFFPDEAPFSLLFLQPFGISLILGLTVVYLFRKHEKITISITQAAIIVVFSWLYASIVGAFPFLLTGQFTYLHGLFESVSGWTTTGLTVVDVTAVPNVILMWRSIMQFIGGAGFAVIMLAVLSGPSTSGVYQAEGHTDEIRPQVKHTTAMVLKIYLIYLAGAFILLLLAGMTPFDAINHAMTALATGGFSTRAGSIGEFASVPIEIVIIVLMILGNINFATHHQLFMGNWKVVLRNAEIRSTFMIILLAVPIIFIFVTIPLYAGTFTGFFMLADLGTWWERFNVSIRSSVFDSISALTGTGFNVVPSFIPWPHIGIFILAILMSLGGHTNSTSGGLKQLRLYMIWKSIIWYVQDQFIPRSAVTQRYIYKQENKTFIKPEHFREVLNYAFLYILTLCLGSAILMGYGYPMQASFFEFSSALGTVGLSYGITNFDAPRGVLITEIIGMFAGRLEFFVIFFSLTKIIRDIEAYYERESLTQSGEKKKR
jgi:trk system potassium uptake protein